MKISTVILAVELLVSQNPTFWRLQRSISNLNSNRFSPTLAFYLPLPFIDSSIFPMTENGASPVKLSLPLVSILIHSSLKPALTTLTGVPTGHIPRAAQGRLAPHNCPRSRPPPNSLKPPPLIRCCRQQSRHHRWR